MDIPDERPVPMGRRDGRRRHGLGQRARSDRVVERIRLLVRRDDRRTPVVLRPRRLGRFGPAVRPGERVRRVVQPGDVPADGHLVGPQRVQRDARLVDLRIRRVLVRHPGVRRHEPLRGLRERRLQRRGRDDRHRAVADLQFRRHLQLRGPRERVRVRDLDGRRLLHLGRRDRSHRGRALPERRRIGVGRGHRHGLRLDGRRVRDRLRVRGARCGRDGRDRGAAWDREPLRRIRRAVPRAGLRPVRQSEPRWPVLVDLRKRPRDHAAPVRQRRPGDLRRGHPNGHGQPARRLGRLQLGRHIEHPTGSPRSRRPVARCRERRRRCDDGLWCGREGPLREHDPRRELHVDCDRRHRDD